MTEKIELQAYAIGDAAAAEEVRSVLRRFQDGYTTRDTKVLDAFMDEFFPQDDRQLIVGTGAIEWQVGRHDARELVEGDWMYWGDVALDVDGAMVSTHGDVAWVAIRGTVTRVIPQEQWFQDTMSYMKDVIEGEATVRHKMLEVFRAASNTMFETSFGDLYVWPLRVTAVLVKEEGRWLFRQMQFSFATLRSPDERVVD